MSFSVAMRFQSGPELRDRRPAPGRSAVPYRYADGFSRRGITDFPLFCFPARSYKTFLRRGDILCVQKGNYHVP